MEITVSISKVSNAAYHGNVKYAEKYDDIVRLLRSGLSVREVAIQTGISKSTVGRIRRSIYEDQRKDTGTNQ